MEFSDVVKSRRSVRDYDSGKQISDKQLRQLFELVLLSPSSRNLQPWEFIVVRSAAGKRLLKKCCNNQQHVEEASAVVVVLGKNPVKNADEVARDRIEKGTMNEARKKSFYGKIQQYASDKGEAMRLAENNCYLATMTLVLAARDMGIDSCIVGSFDPAQVKAAFGVPEDYDAVLAVTLGYGSAKQPERLMRFSYSDIVHMERFGNKAEN